MLSLDFDKFSNRTLIISSKDYEMQFRHSIFVSSFERPQISNPPLNTSFNQP